MNLDYQKICELVDKKDNAGLVAILGDVLGWPVYPAQGNTVARQVEALDHFRKLQAESDDVLRDAARKFLKRNCTISNPDLADGWLTL